MEKVTWKRGKNIDGKPFYFSSDNKFAIEKRDGWVGWCLFSKEDATPLLAKESKNFWVEGWPVTLKMVDYSISTLRDAKATAQERTKCQ